MTVERADIAGSVHTGPIFESSRVSSRLRAHRSPTATARPDIASRSRPRLQPGHGLGARRVDVEQLNPTPTYTTPPGVVTATGDRRFTPPCLMRHIDGEVRRSAATDHPRRDDPDRFGRAGGRPRRPSCSRELPDLDRHLRDASRVAPVETEPAPSESYLAGCVTVERTRDTWLRRLLSNPSAAAKQRARRRSRMRVAMTRRWAAARRRRTSEPPSTSRAPRRGPERCENAAAVGHVAQTVLGRRESRDRAHPR